MLHENDPQRIEAIYRVLSEIASGNFDVRIPESDCNDAIEGIVTLINIAAEELRVMLGHVGAINLRFMYRYLVQHTFVLDKKLLITDFSPTAPTFAGCPATILCGTAFHELLSNASQTAWSTIRSALAEDGKFRCTTGLDFRSENGIVTPALCTVTRMACSAIIVVSILTLSKNDHLNQLNTQFSAPLSDVRKVKPYDAALIRELYEFILTHLDAPLPTVKALAARFGTNEFILKDRFRHYFKTSIYQFYNDERLNRAHLLIQQTDLQLKVVAYMAGFNLYTNFSNAFRKKFGYAPNTIARPEIPAPESPE